MVSPKFTLNWWPGAAVSLAFILTCCALLPYPGLQNDEVIFVAPYFHLAGSSIFDFSMFARHVPVMFMTYMGALKTWICAPVFALAPVNAWTVRLPAVILGAATVWLFMNLLLRICGPRAAWVGGLLLATDTMFVLTTTFDWGPVALQHLLLVAGALLILRFALDAKRLALFLGSLSFGLALWDKALFAWVLGGLTVATLVAFPRELWKRLTPKNAALAVAGFSLGALPLIIYNVATGGETFRSNSSFEFQALPAKARVLLETWRGSALLGYLTTDSAEPGQAHEPRNALERLSFEVRSEGGEHRANRLDGVLLASLLFVPLIWRTAARRILLFSLIALAAAWFQMAITKGAGGAAHHAVLLWPLPHLFMAVTLAEAAALWPGLGTALLAVVMMFTVGANLLLTNQYLYQFARYGSVRSWTDAVYPLAEELHTRSVSQVVVDDWGIVNPLAVLDRGALPLVIVDEEFLKPGRSAAQLDWDRRLLEQGLWVGHTPRYREFVAVDQKVTAAAASAGFRKQVVRLISDRHGRETFEIFRFEKN